MKNTTSPKTIDITPTWQQAINIYLMALENGTEAGKKAAREGLRHMADVAQRYVDEQTKTFDPGNPLTASKSHVPLK